MKTLILITLFAFAGDPMTCKDTPKQAVWDKNCSAQTTKSAIKKTQCAKIIPQFKGLNPRCRWYPLEVRHINGLIAEAFYSKNLEDRKLAFTYLEIGCDQGLCKDSYQRFDAEVKANILVWKTQYPDLLKKAENLRDYLYAKL